MANKLDIMDLKQIINLHLDGISDRQIALALSLNRNTVNHYLRSLKSSDQPLKGLLKLENHILEELISSKTTINNDRFSALMIFFDTMHSQRNHPGFTLQYHYRLYAEQVQDAYSYTQFTTHYQRKDKEAKGSMKLDH